MARKNPLEQIRTAIEPKAPPKKADKDYGGGWKTPWNKGNMEVRRLKDTKRG